MGVIYKNSDAKETTNRVTLTVNQSAKIIVR